MDPDDFRRLLYERKSSNKDSQSEKTLWGWIDGLLSSRSRRGLTTVLAATCAEDWEIELRLRALSPATVGVLPLSATPSTLRQRDSTRRESLGAAYVDKIAQLCLETHSRSALNKHFGEAVFESPNDAIAWLRTPEVL